MKHIITITLLLSFYLSNAQQNQTQILEPFDKIEVFGNIDVEVKQSNKETLKLKAYKVEQDKISIKVVDKTLKVRLNSKLFDEDVKVKVYVTYKELIGIRSDASAEIRVINIIEGNSLTAEAANGGRLLMKVKLDSVEMRLFQGSHIDISGTSTKQRSSVNTGSTLSATDLKCDEVIIKMNTKAKAEIVANKKIEAKVNSYSTLSIFGNPQDKNLKTTIGGSISNWDEDKSLDK